MPRASWRGHLRLSLVSCPVYLSPATARTRSIRLHQVWRAAPADEAGDLWHGDKGEEVSDRAAPGPARDDADDQEQPHPAARIMLRPHDPSTGEEVEKEEVLKGYEYERGK